MDRDPQLDFPSPLPQCIPPKRPRHACFHRPRSAHPQRHIPASPSLRSLGPGGPAAAGDTRGPESGNSEHPASGSGGRGHRSTRSSCADLGSCARARSTGACSIRSACTRAGCHSCSRSVQLDSRSRDRAAVVPGGHAGPGSVRERARRRADRSRSRGRSGARGCRAAGGDARPRRRRPAYSPSSCGLHDVRSGHRNAVDERFDQRSRRIARSGRRRGERTAHLRRTARAVRGGRCTQHRRGGSRPRDRGRGSAAEAPPHALASCPAYSFANCFH